MSNDKMQPAEYFQKVASKQNQRILIEECPNAEIIKGESINPLV